MKLSMELQVLEMVRPAASKVGLESTVEVWGYFVQQCKQRLHVVLCLSPIGNAFRDRLRQNPSLVNCCTIDWFQVGSAATHHLHNCLVYASSMLRCAMANNLSFMMLLQQIC